MNRYRELTQRMKAPDTLEARVLCKACAIRRGAPARRTRFTAAAALAAVALTMTAGAAALRLAGGWQRFFGADDGFPTSAVQELGVSQTRDGYTVTVEQAMASSSRVIVLYSAARADGGEVPAGLSVGRGKRLTRADDPDDPGANGGKSGASVPSYLSDDGRTLHWYDEWHDDAQELLGQTLALELPTLGRSHEETVTLRGDLAAVYASAPAVFSRADLRDGGAAVEAALAAQRVPDSLLSAPAGSGIRLRGAALIDGVPAIALSYPENGADTVVNALYLDADDSEVIHVSGGTPGETLCFYPIGGERFGSADLRFACSLFDVYARGFRLEFEARSATARTVQLGFTAELGGVEAEFVRAEVSSLDVKLVFHAPADAREQIAYAQPITLLFEDGSTLDETARSGFSEGTAHTVIFRPADDYSTRYFPDVSRVTAICVAGHEIRLS